MEAIENDIFFGAVFKSLRFHLASLKTERFQNDAFSKGSTFETVYESLRFYLSSLKTERFQNDPISKGSTFGIVFINVFGRFSTDNRRQRVKSIRFRTKPISVVVACERMQTYFRRTAGNTSAFAGLCSQGLRYDSL